MMRQQANRHLIKAQLIWGIAATVTMVGFSSLAVAEDKAAAVLAESLRFHASFDRGVDADLARGDGKLYTAASLKRDKLTAGIQTSAVDRDEQGKFGGSLRFKAKSPEVILYKGADNMPAIGDGWQATLSMWMELSPEKLPPGYIDPIQVTDKKWNDASLFLDFTKDTPRQFRLGVFADYKFWNPQDRKFETIPEDERPLVAVAKLPFAAGRWIHVAISFRGFNKKGKDGIATLYLDGRSHGTLQRPQRFTWTADKVAIMLGINYVGRIDDLAIFSKGLSASQIGTLYRLPKGVASLR